MKVCVACYGRFHAYNLADQLFAHGHLHSLITGYPYFKARQHTSLSRSLVRTLPHITALGHLGRRLPKWAACGLDEERGLTHAWDQAVARRIPEGIDILDTYAGMSLQTIRRARAKGIKTVLERGSSHRAFQMSILEEEHRRFGMPFEHDPAMMERELREYEETDAIAIPSSYVRKSFLERGVSSTKLLQVPYGVDLSRFRPEPKKDDVFRVIFVGGFSLRKGVQYLLDAWRRLSLCDSELCFIGGHDPKLLEHLGFSNIPRTRFLGPVPNAELRHAISQGDIFVLPSIEEGLALVMAQAMACGLPVIHTTNTGGADLVRHGIDGFEVPIRDADALAEKIQIFHDDRSLARYMGQNALERVKSLGGWSDYGVRTIQGYKRLLGHATG
ncbi:MAG: glycosyltransferase family 4 protein [Planctomycetes bacterium]|nr:glycosyltransferase family 4 protein [Planctomycetota bacterium]